MPTQQIELPEALTAPASRPEIISDSREERAWRPPNPAPAGK